MKTRKRDIPTHPSSFSDPGRPYFVMELVHGPAITAYCDQHELSIRGRLELFIPVCQAVQHAHQKGIIHRDLKPSNILVEEFDDRPVPKVIDFGVAKAIDQGLLEQTAFTRDGQIVGTPQYMSPEQARSSALVDTRSDVYLLGVVLYELLTGEPPLDRRRLRMAAWDEMLRVIREEDPPTPSKKLSSSDALPSVATRRHTEPARLRALVRGELDWIVMKALDKERARRYESPAALARDIEHHLHDQPVLAGPPSAGYRFRKFARRNKRILATVGLIAMAMIVGTAASVYQAVRATRAEHLAEARLEEAEVQRDAARSSEARADQARVEAEAEGRRAELNLTLALDAVDTFYMRAIGRDRLLGERDREDPRREPSDMERTLLKAGLDFYARIAIQNEYSAAAMFRTARAFLQTAMLQANLDDGQAADAAFVESIARLENLTESFPEEAEYFRQLGQAYLAYGNHSRWWPEAKDTFDDAERALTRAIELDPKHAETHQQRGEVYRRMTGDRKALAALADFEKAVELDPTNPERYVTLARYLFVGSQDQRVRDYDRAVQVAEEAVRLAPDRAICWTTLARAHWSAGFSAGRRQQEPALQHFAKALELDPSCAETYLQRSVVYMHTGNYEEAIRSVDRAIELGRKEFRARGEAHFRFGHFDKALADLKLAEEANPNDVYIYELRGDIHLARKEYEAALLDLNKAVELEPGRSFLYKRRASAHFHLGHFAEALGDIAKALELHPGDRSALTWIPLELVVRCSDRSFPERLLELAAAALGEVHNGTLTLQLNLADAYKKAGRSEEAIALLEKMLTVQKAKLGDDRRETLALQHNLAAAYRDAGRLDEAIALHEQTLELRTAKLGPEHPHTLESMNNLGESYRRVGRLEEALALLERTLELSKVKLGSDHPGTLASMNNLALAYLDAGRHAEAEEPARGCLRIRQETMPDDWLTYNAMCLLCRSLAGQARFADAEPLLLDGYQGMIAREKSIPAAGKVRIAEALDAIIQLYEDWDKPEQAERWRQQRTPPPDEPESAAASEEENEQPSAEDEGG